MHFGLSLFFSLFCSSIYLFADGNWFGDLCAATDTSSQQAGVTHNILSCSHNPCRPLELPSWFPSCIWWCIRYGCPCTNILRLIMQGHLFTWGKSLITDYGLPGTSVLYLPIVGFLQWQGCVTGATTQLHHGTRTWQILEQNCNLKIHHLKESIQCKSLYSQGIRQCPYEVAKIVKLGWQCPANAEYFLLVFFDIACTHSSCYLDTEAFLSSESMVVAYDLCYPLEWWF